MDGTILQKRCREFTRCTHATLRELRGRGLLFETGFSWKKKEDEIPFVFFDIVLRIVLLRDSSISGFRQIREIDAKLFNCFQTKWPITWCILKINFESYHDGSKERSYFNRSRLTRKIEKSLNKLLISRATKMQFLKIKIRRRKCRSNDNSSDVQFLRYTNTHTREHTLEKGRIFPVLGRYESTFPIRIEKHGHEEGRHK